MSDWEYIHAHAAELLTRLHQFTIVKQQTGDKTDLTDNSLQTPSSVEEVQKQTATPPEQNGNKPLRRFSPMCQEDATNIAYAREAARQHELFDAEDQANAVRGSAKMIFRKLRSHSYPAEINRAARWRREIRLGVRAKRSNR